MSYRSNYILHVFFKYFFGEPHLATCIFILFNYCMNQDWVQESILAWLWHHFHLALGSNPRPFDREPSALPLDHSFCYYILHVNNHYFWTKIFKYELSNKNFRTKIFVQKFSNKNVRQKKRIRMHEQTCVLPLLYGKNLEEFIFQKNWIYFLK